MTRRDQLFQAVLDAPEDDAPRLVYADHLDEHAGTMKCSSCRGFGKMSVRHDGGIWERNVRCTACSGSGRVPDGNADRAEFIRVQIELSRPDGECRQCEARRLGGQHTNGPCRCTPRRKALRDRERELLEAHGLEWSDPVMEAGLAPACWKQSEGVYGHGDVRWAFLRGFVGRVECSLAAWCGEECEGHMVGGCYGKICTTCRGSGRTNPLGPLVVAAAPVTEVVLTAGTIDEFVVRLLQLETTDVRDPEVAALAWARAAKPSSAIQSTP